MLKRQDTLRYSRQLVLKEYGVKGQIKLKECKCLVIGVGGLGSTVLIQLVAAGIGHIGLVDGDCVEMSNLHRQVIHSEATVGMTKVQSAISILKGINSTVDIVGYCEYFSPSNGLDLLKMYDFVIDCTDSPQARYLINDACVFSGRPLVCASALSWEGQVTTVIPGQGPCYRCIFPKPIIGAGSCKEHGILGIVPCLIGGLQALEAIKIISGIGGSYQGKLVLVDCLTADTESISVKRRPQCVVCGTTPTITSLEQSYLDMSYEQHLLDTKGPVLPSNWRISCQDYFKVLQKEINHFLVDVRPRHHFVICSITGSHNIPLDELANRTQDCISGSRPVYVVSRTGNTSQVAVQLLLTVSPDLSVFSIDGGITQWANEIDPGLPIY